jgi:hypothetical protein
MNDTKQCHANTQPSRLAVLATALLSTLVSALVYTNYLSSLEFSLLSPSATAYTIGSYILYFLWVSLLLALIPLGLTFLTTSKRIVFLTCSSLFTLAHLFYSIDIRVFTFFRFHINGFALDVLRQPNAIKVLGIQWQSIALLIAFLAIVFFTCFLLTSYLSRISSRIGFISWKRAVLAAVALIVVFSLDRLGYAYYGFREIEFASDLAVVLPAYPRVTARKLMIRLKVPVRERVYAGIPSFGIGTTSIGHLSYPKTEMVPSSLHAQRTPNILVLVAESYRSDVLESSVSPWLTAFAKKSLVSREHYSSSNCTHYGFFSLLFSIGPLHFEEARNGKFKPFPIKALRQLGYEIRYTSSAPLNYFGVDQVVFQKEDELLLDHFDNVVEADQVMTNEIKRYLTSSHTKPFFVLGFFNSTHHNYSYPKEHEIFVPVVSPRFSIYDLNLYKKSKQLLNRYRNSAHYVDSLMNQILGALENSENADDTIVVITGDHGESIFEDGRFTHASAFSSVQTKVPLILRIPGVEARNITGITRHVDIFPTVFESMGLNLPPEAYSDGISILNGGSSSGLVTGCSSKTPTEFAIVNNNGFVPFSIEGGKLAMRTALDFRATPRKASQAELLWLKSRIPSALEEMRNFQRNADDAFVMKSTLSATEQ